MTPAGDASNLAPNLVIHHVDNAPAGSVVRGTTWNLTDDAIADSMINAIARGVTVQMIIARSNCDSSRPRRPPTTRCTPG